MATNEKDANLAATASRVQPLPLEVPVTITGDRTVEGSDKREPFSESTTTVLVLAQGTVIRVSAALVPGQRVSLFNEKTKREVVCQVVKSKPAGSTSHFVELQFTEPIAGFWGLLVPGAPPASIPSSPVASGHATPVGTFSPLARPAAATVALSATRPEPATRQSIASPNSAPKSPVAPPPPVATVPRTQPVQPVSSVNATSQTHHTPVQPPAPSIPKPSPAPAGTAPAAPAIPSPVVPKSLISTSRLLDFSNFSKEIDAILAAHKALGSPRVSPSTSTPHPSPAISMPTVEQLKQLAARLQADLRSLPFTSTPAAPPAPLAPPITRKPEPSAAETAKTITEIPWLEPKPAVKSEPVAALPRQEETLPPLSVEAVPNGSLQSVQSFDVLAVEAPRYPQADVIDEQSLGKSTVLPDPITWVGLAAVALLVLGVGGARYFRQNRSGTATPVTTSSPLSSPSPVVFSQPAQNIEQDPSHSASAYPPTIQVSNPVAGRSSPEPAHTRAIHKFPLAAPVVNRAAGVQQAGDDLPALATNSPFSSPDPFTVGGFVGPKGSVAPLPVGGDVKPAQLVKSVPPIYPQLAKTQRVFGNVEIDALIDASGNVATLKVLSGPMVLRQAALDSVKQSKYSPALLDGQPTAMHIAVTVQFRTQ